MEVDEYGWDGEFEGEGGPEPDAPPSDPGSADPEVSTPKVEAGATPPEAPAVEGEAS